MVVGGSPHLACRDRHVALRQRRGASGRSATQAPGGSSCGAGPCFPRSHCCFLLAFALWLMPALRPFAAPADAVADGRGDRQPVLVAGRLSPAGRQPVASANEVRLPVGERVEFALASDDVIHSFWIPALGGKMDMIPGRTNRLSLLATKRRHLSRPVRRVLRHVACADGVLRRRHGAGRLRAWLDAQARARRGRAPASGARALPAQWLRRLPPRRRHRGARPPSAPTSQPCRLAADDRRRHPAQRPKPRSPASSPIPASIKPGAQMPAFGMLPAEEIAAIAAWLKGLE